MSATATLSNARRRARRLGDPQAFAEGGAREAARLYAATAVRGPRATLRDELATEREYVSGADSAATTLLRAGQSGSQLVGVMLTITLAAAIGFVGVKVISEIQGSITDKDLSATADANQSVYENTSETISTGFSDAMGLTDIVFLVLMFGVVLGALLAFRSRR